MAVGLQHPTQLSPVAGIRLASASAGIYKHKKRHDMLLIQLVDNTRVAACFTQNRFCAAPVLLAKDHLLNHSPSYLLINAGNANAGTGKQGVKDALSICHDLAQLADCQDEQVLPFSTGVIGEYLPVENMKQALGKLLENLSDDNWLQAASTIMTTDTVAKGISCSVSLDNSKVTFTGICKGAGMIKPNMATMLAFIATDACIEKDILQQALNTVVNKSFNRISVDGDTSTNDACVLMATGKAGNNVISSIDSHSYREFCDGLYEVCSKLAQAIVRDGEGATKFVSVHVKGGASSEECLSAAYSIAHSPLVKTALTASDANWGRILAAVGNADISELQIDNVQVYLGDVCIVENGQRAASYTEEQGQKVMQQPEITITVDLGQGDTEETIWTTDLSHDYIKINAEYRT